jgi:hypothetical protein
MSNTALSSLVETANQVKKKRDDLVATELLGDKNPQLLNEKQSQFGTTSFFPFSYISYLNAPMPALSLDKGKIDDYPVDLVDSGALSLSSMIVAIAMTVVFMVFLVYHYF